MQGAGNDFVLIESDDDGRDWSGTAADICDRHYGIGADGLLVMMPSDTADFRMRIFNADGSEPDICGNGLRCMIRYFVLSGQGVARDTVSIETSTGILHANLRDTSGNGPDIRVSMGKPGFEEAEIPVENGQSVIDIEPLRCCTVSANGMSMKLHLVSMGNPHAVRFIENEVGNYPLLLVGPEVEVNRIFPEGTNFETAKIIDRRNIEARVWERGVGETLACGSGACAIAVAARINGYTDDEVNVKLPGGVLKVEWDGSGDVLLSGPAEKVFTGEWPD